MGLCGRASGTVKLGAEWAALGASCHQAAWALARGPPCCPCRPSPLPRATPCCSYFSGRPSSSDSESFLPLDGPQQLGSLSGDCTPVLELARGDASLGSQTSSCAHWGPDLLFSSADPLCTCVHVCVQASAWVSMCLHVCAMSVCMRVCVCAHTYVRAEELGGAGCPWTASQGVRSVIGSLGCQSSLPLGRDSRAGSRNWFLAKSPASLSPLARSWGGEKGAAQPLAEGAPRAEG